MLDCLAQFSLFAGESIQDLRPPSKIISSELRIRSKSLAKALVVDSISTSEEYQRVLELRLKSYKEVNKVSEDATPEDMADEYDHRSIIVAATCNGRLVGTVRMVRCDSADDLFPFEEYIKSYKISDALRSSAYETSRLAIEPEFQGTDVVLRLFQTVFENVLRSGSIGTFCVATRSLETLYTRMGAARESVSVPHPRIENETMALFYLDRATFINGSSMSAHAWKLIAKEPISHFSEFGFCENPKNKASMWVRMTLERLFLSIKKKSKVKRAA